VDGAGNVFVADTGNNLVKEIVAANGVIPASPTINTLGSGFTAPTGVTVDQNGNVIVDNGDGRVKEILAAGGYTSVNALGGNFTYPVLQATDASGNVFTADTSNDRILKTDHADSPQLVFAPTLVNSTSADSPQTVTVSNIGNANLTFPVPAAGNNASISTGFTPGDASTCPELNSSSSAFTLAPGNSCSYVVSFSPATAGPFDGSLVLTDNNLNASGTQTIGLYGTTLSSQTINFSPPSPVTFGVSPIALTASATSGLTVTLTVVSGPGTLSNNLLTVTGAGTIVISADQAGNASYAPVQTTANIIVSPATPTITWATPSAITYGTPLSAAQLDATLSVAGSCTYSPIAGTVLNSGTQTLTATCTPTDTTDYNSAMKTVSLMVNATALTLVTPAPSSVLPDTNTVTFSWSSTATILVSFRIGSAFGGSDLYIGTTTSTSLTVTIPHNGVQIYATLEYEFQGAWHGLTYTFTEYGSPTDPMFSIPSTVTNSTATFSWTAGAGASAYELLIGTKGQATSNIYHSGTITSTSVVVHNLPASGTKVDVELFYRMGAIWKCSVYTYTEP